MAITINSAGHNQFNAVASGYVSAHEDIWHVVDSTNKNVTGFKYIFDIYKGNDLLTRVANSPYGADKTGIINVGNIVRSGFVINGLGIDLITPYTDGVNVVDESTDYWFTEYNVRYGEICGTTNLGAPNILPDLASGSYRVYNTYNRHTIHGAGGRLSNSKIFLTNRPQTSKFYQGEPVVITINNRFDAPGETAYNLHIDDEIIGDSETYDGFSFFSLNNLTETSTFYIMPGEEVGKPPPLRIAELNLQKQCIKYKPYTLIFMNSYGAWDSFTFVNGNILTDNEKKKFERNRWQLSAGRMYDYFASFQNEAGAFTATQNEGMKTYGVKFKTKMKLTSDLLNTDEYKWLFELIVSPFVYLWDKTATTLYPVQITDTNYEIKNSLQNKTESVEVNIDVFDQNTQYR